MAKPEPRQGSRNLNSGHSSISNVLWFRKCLLRSYFVKDTASLEDTLKDQVPLLKNLGNNCKDNTISVWNIPNWRSACIMVYTNITNTEAFRYQLTWMKHAENKPQWQLKDLGCERWVHSKRGFFFFLIGNLSLIKNIYKKFTPDIIINGENLIAFPLRSGTSPRISPFTTVFQYYWMS